MPTALELKDLGNAALLQKKYDEAIEKYTQAIEADPKQAVFYLNRAQAYIKTECYGLAIEDATSAIEVDPKYTKAYYRRAVAHAALLDYKKAIADLKIVLARVPGDKTARNYLNEFVKIEKKRRFEEAIRSNDEPSALESLRLGSVLVGEHAFSHPLEISVKPGSKDQKEEFEIHGLNQDFIDEMISVFKQGGKLPRQWAYAIVAKTAEILAKESTLVEISQKKDISENVILIPDHLTVCGDTHGQFYDLLNIFSKFGSVSDGHAYLFNGDFVDRGSWSTEVAFLLYALKIVYPTRIFINRGNHETSDMNQVYGFEGECKAKYNETLYKLFTESFGVLPLATLVNGLWLVMHGGLFSNDDVTLDDIRALNRFKQVQPPKEGIAMELLWTDPQETPGRKPNRRGIGIQFGPDVTENFCKKNGIEGIIRSHEVRMGGYEKEHNGKLITVFSAPNYCDSTGNLGAVVEFKNDSMECISFEAVPHPDIKPMAYTTNFGY